jgi:moderate conductance mechanosensitive channel
MANVAPHTFFGDLGRDWIVDLQNFLHVGLPKLIFITLFAWGLILLVNVVAGKVVQAAERRAQSRGSRPAQLRTVVSVVRATGIGIVVSLAFLQIMENVLDFNLGPLLASAGVAGVAIGLAAQTIVKDVINGFLILLEDQYNVGDVVTLAGMTGTVDSMTLRKTILRGFDGILYTIPNSQITNVANLSREFSVSVVSVSVDFSANPDKVIPLLQKIAAEVRNDPAYKDVFLEDPKVLGVDSIKGSEVIYPIQIKTLARQQFGVIRELQRRIRLALEENQILSGSPYRVTNQTGPTDQSAVATLVAQPAANAAADPTTAKPNETNPFTGN